MGYQPRATKPKGKGFFAMLSTVNLEQSLGRSPRPRGKRPNPTPPKNPDRLSQPTPPVVRCDYCLNVLHLDRNGKCVSCGAGT